MEDDLTWEWRRLHNEELSDMDSSRSIVKVNLLQRRIQRDIVINVKMSSCKVSIILVGF